jgi:Flp pilus assembly protein CpaB
MGIVVMAILAGLVGAYVVRNSLLKPPPAKIAAPVRQITPLATANLPAGRTLTLGDIGLASMTHDEMVEKGYEVNQMMMSPEQIIGRTLREPITQGQPFLTSSLYLEGTRRDFTAELRPGYRAYSMPLAKDRGGALPSGSMVDVFFRSAEQRATSPGERNIPEVTVQLFQGVQIIDVYDPPPPPTTRNAGVDLRSMGPRVVPSPTVTLAVTPEQAQILQATGGRGELTLVARPENERAALNQDLRGKTLDDILGIQPPPPAIVFATEVFRGGQRSLNVYRNDKLAEELSRQADPPPSAPVDPPAAAPAAVVPVPVPVPVAPAAPPSLVPRVPPRGPMVPGPVGPVPMLP